MKQSGNSDWETIRDALHKYADHFRSTYPTYGLDINENTVEIIERCLREDKDVYELGYLPDPSTIPDVYY